MSFDVDVQLVDKYFDQGFPRSVVEEAFRSYMHPIDAGLYRLTYPEGGSSDLYLEQTPVINGFGVMAAGGNTLYDGIYKIMSNVPHLYMYWGGGSVVTDPATIPLMPDGLIKEFGSPTVVHSGQEIIDAIERGP